MIRSSTAILALVMAWCVNAHAQPTWLIYDATNTVTLEIVRPSIKPDNKTTGANLYLGFKYEVVDGYSIVGELPFGIYSFSTRDYDIAGGDASNEEFGNPYIGVEAASQDRRVFLEAGLRIPVFNESALTSTRWTMLNLANMADMDRTGAFTGYYIPLKIILNGYPVYDYKHFSLKCRAGIVNLYTNEEKRVHNLSYALYTILASYRLPQVEVQAGWGGIYLTDGYLQPQNRAYDNATLAVNIPFGQWHIGAVMRWPLTENIKDRMSNILHVGVSYGIE